MLCDLFDRNPHKVALKIANVNMISDNKIDNVPSFYWLIDLTGRENSSSICLTCPPSPLLPYQSFSNKSAATVDMELQLLELY